MGWVRVSDDFYDHPRFADVSPLSVALWLTALAWCNRNLTDGFIPRTKARTLLDFDGITIQISQSEFGLGMADAEADFVIAELLDAGLFEGADGGYRLHDYHDYQPTSDEVRAKQIEVSKRRAEAGRKGGLSTQNRRSGEANKQTDKQPGKQTSSNAPSKIQAPTPTPIPKPLQQQQTDTSRGTDDRTAAADLITATFDILYARRPPAHTNPARHRQTIFEALAAEHEGKLAELDWDAPWTPQMLADWLEPVPTKPQLSVVREQRHDPNEAYTTPEGRTFLPGSGWVG